MEAYEADLVEITLLSTFTLSSGLSIFTIFREYLFYILIGLVCLVFVVTEYRNQSIRRIEGKKDEILGDGIFEGVSGVNEMTLETFLDLTRQGSPLCIVDGYVIDIGTFMTYHPGGSRVLRGAIGADITQQMLGQRGVSGIIHAHSPIAFRKLRQLVKARLQSSTSLLHDSRDDLEANSPSDLHTNPSELLVFREGKIIDYTDLSLASKKKSKAILRILISLKKEELDRLPADSSTPLPSTTFTFRGIDTFGTIVERPYTPVSCHFKQSEENPREVEGTMCNNFNMFFCFSVRAFVLN